MNGKVASESGVASGLLRISDDEVINFNSHLDINSGGIDDDAFTDETSEWPKNRPAQINWSVAQSESDATVCNCTEHNITFQNKLQTKNPKAA